MPTNEEEDMRTNVAESRLRWWCSPWNCSLLREGALMWKGRMQEYEQSGAVDGQTMRHCPIK
jgi:hypothetical protein